MVTYWFTVCYRVRTEVYWHPRFVFLVNLSVWLREAVSALSGCRRRKNLQPYTLLLPRTVSDPVSGVHVIGIHF